MTDKSWKYGCVKDGATYNYLTKARGMEYMSMKRYWESGRSLYCTQRVCTFLCARLLSRLTARAPIHTCSPTIIRLYICIRFLLTEEGRGNLVNSTKSGFKKVREVENYALILESMVAKHEMNKQPCDVMQVGTDFAARSYGLAVPRVIT